MASGKAKYIAGLHDLVGGFTLMEERRRARLAERLEREKFEYEKARDKLLDEAAAQEARQKRIIDIREKNFDRMIDMGKQRQDEAKTKYDRVIGARDKAFDRMLRMGNLDLSKQREQRLSLPDASSSGGGESYKPTEDDKIRDRLAGLNRYINQGLVAMPKDKWGDTAAEAEVRAQREREYRGASTLQDIPAQADAYESMSEEEWLETVNAAISDALGRSITEEEIDTRPEMQIYVFADPRHRRRLFNDIPRMFIREPTVR